MQIQVFDVSRFVFSVRIINISKISECITHLYVKLTGNPKIIIITTFFYGNEKCAHTREIQVVIRRTF